MNRQARRILLRSVAALACGAGPAVAGDFPFVNVGDMRLREDIELLADAGLIEGPTTVWPLPVSHFKLGETLDRADLLPEHRAALERVNRQISDTGTSIELIGRATTEPALLRTFSDQARQDIDTSVRLTQRAGNLFAQVQVNYRDDPGAHNVNLDGTSLYLKLGNWAVHGGFTEMWWGPSLETSLVLSNNLRPFPKVGITRLEPKAFDNRWLRWIGPWRVDAFVGMLTDERSDPYKDPLVVGLRLTVQPTHALQIGVSRLLQLCGSGRPCGADTWLDSLVPIGSPDNTGTLDEPGNQAVSFDVRYAPRLGDTQGVFYLQGYAEDTVLEVLSLQLGAKFSGQMPLGTWRLGAEVVDTYGRTFSKDGFNDRQGGSTYVHFIYRDGFSFHKRAIGYSLDGDSKQAKIMSSLTDNANRRWSANISRLDINVTNLETNRVSANREKLWLLEAGVDWPSRFGDIHSGARWQTDSSNTPGEKDSSLGVELRWSLGF